MEFVDALMDIMKFFLRTARVKEYNYKELFRM